MELTELSIERGIPVPAHGGGPNRRRFPFPDMEVGDSFLVPWRESESKTRSNISNAMAAYKLRHAPKDFTSRKTDGGVRVWRIA